MIPLLLTLSGCGIWDWASKPDPLPPIVIYKSNHIDLPYISCPEEPAVPPLLTDKALKPKDTDALQWAEDTRKSGFDCREAVKADKFYQDGYNKKVDESNADKPVAPK